MTKEEYEELEKQNKELHQKIIYLENDKENILANWYCDKVGECKVAELEKENAELKSIAEFQQSSNMSKYFENKKLKEVLAVGSTFNKALNSRNKFLEEEVERYRNMVFDKIEMLDKAKELLNDFIKVSKSSNEDFPIDYAEIQVKAEQFLKEVSE